MNRLNRILVATDFSKASENALDHAALIALKNDAVLHLLHVRVPFPNSSIDAMAREFPDPERLQEVVERFAHNQMEDVSLRFNVPVTKKIVNAFDAAQAIADYAEDEEIDLVVVGTHGRGAVGHFFLGSVAERTIRYSPVSVLAVGSGESHELGESSYRKVLVPIDFSEASKRALKHGAAIAKQHAARLLTLHVVERVPHPGFYFSDQESILGSSEQFHKRLRGALTALIEEQTLEVPADSMVGEGRAYKKICEVAREQAVDLIVMGAHGLGKIERLLLGSVTERVIRSAPCPVLVDKSLEAVNV